MSESSQPQQMQLALGPNPHPTSIPLTTEPPSTNSSAVTAPRPPHAPTLQEALRWSIEARGDAPAHDLKPLSEEDKKFLQGALDNMQGNADETNKLVAVLSNPEADTDALCDALDTLLYHAEDIDFSLGLHNLGAFGPIVSLAQTHADTEVQWRALNLIAVASQNHPTVQQVLRTHNSLSCALQHIHRTANDTVRLKAVLAVSCLVRGNLAHAEDLSRLNGVNVLATSIRTANARTRVKILHLLRYVLTQASLREHALAENVIEAVVSSLDDASGDVWEQALSCLVDMRPAIPDRLRAPLRTQLESRERHLAGAGLSADETEAERRHAAALKQSL